MEIICGKVETLLFHLSAANAFFYFATSFNAQLVHWDEEAFADSDAAIVEDTSTSQMDTEETTSTAATALMGALPKKKFADTYELKDKIRKGSFATVWRCADRETNEVFAVKIIKRQGLDPKDDEAVLNEASIMQSLHHNKYVVNLVDFYEEPDYFYLVMENMCGGDVFDRIVDMAHYTEKDARDLILTLLKAVYSLHQANIAHRDIKPQNLLLESKDDHAAIKLADFGFAKRVHTPESLTSRVGTPSYVAPEVRLNHC